MHCRSLVAVSSTSSALHDPLTAARCSGWPSGDGFTSLGTELEAKQAIRRRIEVTNCVDGQLGQGLEPGNIGTLAC